MHGLRNDFLCAIRSLKQHAGFWLIAVVTLALGIGANVSIFSVFNGVLLKPLPYPAPDRIVHCFTSHIERKGEFSNSAHDFADWRQLNQCFESIASYRSIDLNYSGTDQPIRFQGSLVSPGFTRVLGVAPSLGRAFIQEEEQQGKHRVVLLSHKTWNGTFGADPNIIGRTLTFNQEPYQVIGIMPEGFGFPTLEVDMWTPLTLDLSPDTRGNHYLRSIARLKPGVSLPQAQSEMDAISRDLQQRFPETNAMSGVKLVSMYERLTRDIRPALLVLLAAAIAVLLIACANIANLQLARMTARSREIAVRLAVGASRWQLLRLFLVESWLLTLPGGLLGLLLAVLGTPYILKIDPTNIPRVAEIGLDWRVLAFAIGLTVVTGLGFGITPIFQAFEDNVGEKLKSRGEGGGHLTWRYVRNTIVVAQVALALVLLLGAGLFLRSFLSLQQTQLGFNPTGILTARVTIPTARYKEYVSRETFFRSVMREVEAFPNLQSAAAVSELPLTGARTATTFQFLNLAGSDPTQSQQTDYRVVTPNYFKTMEIQFLQGRDLTDRDSAKAPGAVVVNETFVSQFLRGEEPLGKKLTFDDPQKSFEIVGVVRTIKHDGALEDTLPEVYMSLQQQPVTSMFLVLRSSNPSSLSSLLQPAVSRVDKDVPVHNVRTLASRLGEYLAPYELNALLTGIFGSVALALAAIGIFGVMNYVVSQRIHEIGIRMALGAQQPDVIWMILLQGLKLAGFGIAIGLALALASLRLLDKLLYGVSPTDSTTFAVVAITFLGIATLACFIPARWASKVDPLVALRYE
ncbi:MAG: ABC transporter permease [Acidobacteria bacterium]|nr:ABC transporter permease [Acidobacteriota bacterium]